MRGTQRDALPLEWRVHICPHTEEEKHDQDLDWNSEQLALDKKVKMQWCWCKGFEIKALKTCAECKELKPNNFAHPGRCCVDKSDYHLCWDCLNKQGGRDKCPCDDCQKRNFKFGILAKDSMWYARVNRLVAPPAYFQPINTDNIEAELDGFDF